MIQTAAYAAWNQLTNLSSITKPVFKIPLDPVFLFVFRKMSTKLTYYMLSASININVGVEL